jgi:succinyl-diaminopimelate desuccinylase
LIDDVVAGFSTNESPIAVRWLEGWPAYRVSDGHEIVRTLQETAESIFGRHIPTAVSGPSNIGNYLATLHIPAVCGFGVTYRNLHAADESIDVTSIEPVYQTYMRTLLRLLKAD